MTLDLLTAGGLTAAFATLLSLLFILIPGARAWFEGLSADAQQALTGVAILIMAAVAVGLGCTGVIVLVPCTVTGVGDYFIGVVFAAILGDRVSKGWFAAARYRASRSDGVGERSFSTRTAGKLLG